MIKWHSVSTDTDRIILIDLKFYFIIRGRNASHRLVQLIGETVYRYSDNNRNKNKKIKYHNRHYFFYCHCLRGEWSLVVFKGSLDALRELLRSARGSEIRLNKNKKLIRRKRDDDERRP